MLKEEKAKQLRETAFALDNLLQLLVGSSEKARVMLDGVCQGYFGKSGAWAKSANGMLELWYEYERTQTKLEIAYDYIYKLQEDIDKLRELSNGLFEIGVPKDEESK